MIDPNAPLLLSVALFSLGIVGVFARRSVLLAFLGVELMLCASVLALASFDLAHTQASAAEEIVAGRGFAVMILSVAIAQTFVGLGLLVAARRNQSSAHGDAYPW